MANFGHAVAEKFSEALRDSRGERPLIYFVAMMEYSIHKKAEKTTKIMFPLNQILICKET